MTDVARLTTALADLYPAEMIGHASIAMTPDTYSHVLPGMQAESAARLEDLLFGSQQST